MLLIKQAKEKKNHRKMCQNNRDTERCNDKKNRRKI